MAVKTLTTRVQQKSDTSVNWAKATNFTPLKGEIIVYTDLNKIKIGDGVTKVGVLEFVNAKDAETLMGASLSTILNDSEVEIPTSKAVSEAIDSINQGLTDYVKTSDLDSVAFDGYVTKGKKSGTTVGSKATAEGKDNTASGNYSHAEGNSTVSSGQYSHSEGYNTTASGTSSHSEGYSSKVVPDTITSSTRDADIITEWNSGSFAFANGPYSHVEGLDNLALGSSSHAEGRTTISSGTSSHSEGFGTVASEYGSHAEGWQTTSSHYASHSEGRETTASGNNSHAEGYGTLSSGENSHAEGVSTVASGRGSHAEGEGTSAMSALQHVEGKYNIKDYVKYAHIVGNGTSDSARSNAHTLDWSGNAWYAGKVSVGTTSNVPTPTNANDLVTKKYVDNKFSTRTASVTLASTDWAGTESPYSQEVTVDGATSNSKVDLQPTGEQLNSLATNRTILNTANDNGTVTVYAIGNKPTEDYTMQATITEV